MVDNFCKHRPRPRQPKLLIDFDCLMANRNFRNHRLSFSFLKFKKEKFGNLRKEDN